MEISTGPVSAAIVAFRNGRDFSERDRAMMTMLRPHLANMYRTIETLTDLGERIWRCWIAVLMSAVLGAIVLRDNDMACDSMTDVGRSVARRPFRAPRAAMIDCRSPVVDWLKRGREWSVGGRAR